MTFGRVIRWKYFDAFLILSLSAISFSWFQPGTLFVGSDMIIPLEPIKYLDRFQFAWDQVPDGGAPLDGIARAPWYGYFALFDLVGLPLNFGIAIFYVLIFFVGGLSMYYLYSELARTPRISRITVAIFYMFSPFVLTFVRHPLILLMYFAIPLNLLMFHKAIHSRLGKYSLYAVLAFSLIFVAFPVYSWPIMVTGLLLGYLILEVLRGKDVRYKNIPVMVALFFGLNMGWFLPILQNAGTFAVSLSELPLFPPGHTYNQISRAILGLGHWGLYGSSGEIRYFVPGDAYLQSPFVLVSLSILVLAAFSSLLISSPSSRKTFFGILAIVVIFLVKGTNPPFGEGYSWLLANFLPFRAFRVPTENLAALLMLPYAYLIGCFLADIDRFRGKTHPRNVFKKVSRVLVPAFMIGIITIAASPLLNGTAMTSWYNHPNKGVIVPASYLQASQWLDNQEDVFRVLVYPSSGTYMATDWGYQGANLYNFWFNQRLILAAAGSYQPGATRDIANSLYVSMYSGDISSSLSNLYGLLGVNYVIFDQTSGSSLYGLPTNNDLRKQIEDIGMLEVNTFDRISIYKNPNQVVPLIYPATTPIILNATIEHPDGVTYTDDFQVGWESSLLSKGRLEGGDEAITFALKSEGNYTNAFFSKSFVMDDESRYLIIGFKTNIHSSLLVAIKNQDKVEFISSVNPPPLSFLNHYTSTDLYSIVFRIPQELRTEVEVLIYVTNRREPNYQGTLELELEGLMIAESIGSLEDVSLTISREFTESSVTIEGVSPGATLGPAQDIPLPILQFEEINPTRYEVQVTASGPFYLVFSEGFSKNWIAFLDGNRLDNHFVANLYANGWYLESGGDFDITILYGPQFGLQAGRIISVITIGIILIYFIQRRLR